MLPLVTYKSFASKYFQGLKNGDFMIKLDIEIWKKFMKLIEDIPPKGRDRCQGLGVNGNGENPSKKAP
jgi:hypothetical protein